jgi:hypothetical protein
MFSLLQLFFSVNDLSAFGQRTDNRRRPEVGTTRTIRFARSRRDATVFVRSPAFRSGN